MPIHVNINQRAVAAAMTGPNGPVVAMVERVSRRVLNEARRRAPVDEGRLRASLQATVNVRGQLVVGRIGTDVDYAAYVMFGTGLYGPRKALIYPVSAKVMTWIPRTGGQGAKRGGRKTARDTTRVFARYTRGQRPQPFLVAALEAVSPWPVSVHRV